MTTQTAMPALTPMPYGAARAAVMAGSTLTFFGAITIFAWSFLNWDDSTREVVTGPGEFIGCALAAVGGVLLLLALPRVLTGLAPGAVAASIAALAFVLVDAWYNGTVAIAVANQVDDGTYDTIIRSGWAFLFSLPKMLLGLAGFIGLAVSGWRTGLVSRPLAVLLAVGGVASLVPPFMPGILIASIAFFLLARAQQE
ncbi:MAG TPA: hypothetical protein VFK32_02360 [Tepidiformaceae bacterium]|nr:hypothetical protein [Tepidiformaceae bacterium]